LVAKALRGGVALSGLGVSWLPGAVDPPAGLVLGFAAVGESGIAEALGKLRKVWRG